MRSEATTGREPFLAVSVSRRAMALAADITGHMQRTREPFTHKLAQRTPDQRRAFERIFFIARSSKARRVSVRTFPWAPPPIMRAVAVSSSGAS